MLVRRGHYKDPFYLPGTDDEQMWTFRMEGSSELGCYESCEAAIEAAELLFFTTKNPHADFLIEQAFTHQNYEHAVKLAERRGYWLGRLHKLENQAKLIKSVIDQLESMTQDQM